MGAHGPGGGTVVAEVSATDADALIALARTLGTLGATVLLVTYLGRLAISYQRDFTLQYRELSREQEATIERLRDRHRLPDARRLDDDVVERARAHEAGDLDQQVLQHLS